MKSAQKSGIITDQVAKDVYFGFNYATSCEDCTHFDFKSESCTFGYPTEPHRKAHQIKAVEEVGRIAFCRAIEID